MFAFAHKGHAFVFVGNGRNGWIVIPKIIVAILVNAGRIVNGIIINIIAPAPLFFSVYVVVGFVMGCGVFMTCAIVCNYIVCGYSALAVGHCAFSNATLLVQ